ncbi:MAG TPA: ribose ABC transporter permease [Acidimicrobiia bacterium]|nr:ribose ABC transporter permease [Acidimicrobiia bacterium]
MSTGVSETTSNPEPVAAAPPEQETAVATNRSLRTFRLLRDSGIFLALILLVVIGGILSPHFLQPGNILNVLRQVAIVGILGIGMTFVILTAGIDLSVGSIVGFAAIAAAAMMSSGLAWPLAIPLALLAGALVGAINGLGITKGRLQPFIMTLGMLVIVRGVTMTFARGQPISLGEAGPSFVWLGSGTLLGIPVPVWLLLAIAGLAGFTLRHTTFGRHVYAVGDNPEAARLSGIKTDRVIFLVYVISGLCAAVSALIIVSRLTAGEPSQGTGFELDAIAIVVIGGTSLFGGEGGVLGTLVGAGIVAAMANLLNLLGVSPFSQQIVKGLIILGAVLLERRGASKGSSL